MYDLTSRDLALLWAPPLVYVLAYVPLCRALVRHKRIAAAVLSCRSAHNVLMAVYSAAALAGSIWELSARPLTPYGLLCQPVTPAPLLVKTWYASKFVEWVDTTLLLAAGKSLSALHYNHHLTTATVVASHFVGRDVRTSIFDVPLFLNALVHTLMYGYYWRPALLRPIKRLLTRMQIVQHMTVLLAVVYTTTTRLYGGAECDISVRANGLSLCLYGMYLAQFLLFYGRAYGGGEGKARTRRAD